MKIKLRKVLPRLLALFLILTMAMTPSIVKVVAAPESSTGSTNPNYKGDPGTFEYDKNLSAVFRPAWLVYIQKVDNTCDGVDIFDYSATNTVNPDSQCKRSVVDAMLWNYPEDYRRMDNTLAERSFVVVNKGSAAIDLNKISIYKPDGSGVTGKVKAYNCTGTAPATISINCITDDVLGTTENAEAFRKCEFTWEQYQAGIEVPYDLNGISLEEAKSNFIKQFNDVGGISGKINYSFNGAITAYPDLIDVIRNAHTLNLLAVISNLCANPSVYDEYIQDFLISQNRDGSSSFYVPVIIAGYVANDNNGNEGHRFYSLPSYYQRAYGFNANELMELDPDGDGISNMDFGDYGDIPDTYENEVYRYIMSMCGGSKSKYYSLRTGVWWAHAYANSQWISYTGQAYTCMPTDLDDAQHGNLGYTYFAFGGAGGKPTDGIGQFQITASSEQKTVTTPGASVAALINIDLKSTGQQLQQYKDTFAQEKAKGYDKADLIINYSFEAVKGNGSSSPLIDNAFTAGATLSSGNKVTIPNLTYDQIKPYLEGSKLVQVADSGIIINDSVTNKYLATVTLKFSDKSYSIYAKGKTIESEFKASDTVSWGYKKDDPNTWHFYSTIGKNGSTGQDNYVEIKEGSPGNESFEAMAGVPTTENLYVGFGATEFMMNMDVKLDTSKGVRNYYYIYNAANCIGNDQPCEYSCPGHPFATGGCGKVLSRDSHGNPTSTCDSGTSITLYCKSGPATGVTKCSCGAKVESHEVTPTWGAGYSECLGGDGSKDYTGMGCVHTEHTNSTHKGVIFQGCIQQPIASFNYMNITALDLWRVNKLELKGNSKLLSNPNQSWDPDTGYYAFYNQDGYSNGNGRLVFITNLEKQDINNRNIWGDTTYECPNPSTGYITWDAACSLASQWMNECAANTKVSAVVVSDYLSLCTTEGYQTPAFHSYDSDIVQLTNEAFNTVGFVDNIHGTSLSPIKGNEITFSSVKTGTDFWVNNKNTAFKWESDHITRSGYNGNYSSPSTKWNNVNVTSNKTLLVAGNKNNIRNTEESIEWFNKLAQLIGEDAHPNSKNREGNKSFAKGFSNLRMTHTGLDINDVMSTDDRTWPQNTEPRVKNGEWDTGNCYLYAKKEISYGTMTGGTDYSTESDKSYKQEVGYTAGKTKVNNIVVHNPVSTQNAYVICNDKKYDLRSDASLAAGGDPANGLSGCPNNASCQYQTLTCTEAPSPHTDACYTEVSVATEHVGGLNAHEHVSAGQPLQNVAHKHDTTCYKNCGGSLESYTVYHRADCPNVGSTEKKSNCTSACKLVTGTQKDYVEHASNCTNKGNVNIITSDNGDLKKCTDCHQMKATPIYKCKSCGEIYESVSGACSKQILTCTKTTDIVDNSCTHAHSYANGCYDVCGGSISTQTSYGWHDCGECGYNPCIRPVYGPDGWEYVCTKCGATFGHDHPGSCPRSTLTCTKSTAAYAYCTHSMNKHVCTSECHTTTQKVLTCTNPHHYNPGENWDYNSAASHYEYGDPRCWSACGNDDNHMKQAGMVVVQDGNAINISDTFINIDREFKIYYPDTGDFAQSPGMLGILDTTDVRGKGYTDGMNCAKWTRDKYVVFPVNVIYKDANGNFTKQATAGQPINLNYVPSDGNYIWSFYCVLGNSEQCNSSVKFLSVASNAALQEYYDESIAVTNKDRVDRTHAAKHTASKQQYVDVLGYIGGLTLEDTGDFRFATLFKKSKNNNKWLIKNLVPEVSLNLPNKIVSDSIDVRQEIASADTDWHDTYGTQYSSTGGKAYQHLSLPLVPKYNPIVSLQNQPLRPGYNLYMDISTVGDYYGENIDINGDYVDSDLYYKMQVTPRYWALDLDTKKYYPVDVYMGESSNYTGVAFFDCENNVSEYYMYLDWLNTAFRRNYTSGEKESTGKVVDFYTPTGDNKLRSPSANKDILGTAQRLHLNDLNRTFIGSTFTYGENRNPESVIPEEIYIRQAQRWHFTIGLPSSSVFVKAGKPCTDVNIKEISEMNAVIVCSLDIKVRGTVWTLEYDGLAVNNNGGKFQIVPDGEIYSPPIDPETGKTLTDPIVAVYSNKMTSADDLRTEGSH